MTTASIGTIPFKPSPDALAALQALADAGDLSDDVAGILSSGLAAGMNPNVVAAQLGGLLNGAQAVTMARTEMLGAYRDAAISSYNANSDVVSGWMWSASDGACIACAEEDGTIHDLDEDMDGMTHYSCRCSPIPVTSPWSDILGPAGIDASGIEETSVVEDYVPLSEKFNGMSFEERAAMLGSKSAAVAVEGGMLSPHDFLGVDKDTGRIYTKSLKEALTPQYAPGSLRMEQIRQELAETAKGYHELNAGAFEIREPPAAALQKKRDALAEQREAAQVKLDTLSGRWIDLVLKQAEFDPEEDPEMIAAFEERIAKVEAQQAAQLAKLERLDQQIAAQDRKLAEATMPGSARVAMLRQQVDDSLAQRELLYGQQHDLLEEQAKLENMQREAVRPGRMDYAELQAKHDLYRQTLDQNDPLVKRYLKDYAAREQTQADMAAARAEQSRLEHVMDALSIQGKKGSAEFAQAKADYDAAVKAYEKAEKAGTKAWDNLWTKSPGVYKPELDSIYGFEHRMEREGITFSRADIAKHPLVVAERERLATLGTRIADLKAQVRDLEKPIKDINKEIDRQLTQLRDLHATLRGGGEALDTMRPFSDVLPLPEGHQPPNALMNKLDYRMNEPREVTKGRIIDDITTRLKDNPAWRDYVSRTPTPNNLGVYHQYVHVYASERDTKSAKLVADIIRKWGVGYRPGSPQWVAQQMAVRDEFGLDAALHAVTPAQIRAGEAAYAENGAALRSFMRAMYDNTQQWFADNGITEVEVYRGYSWEARSENLDRAGNRILQRNPDIPQGINWGPLDGQNHGITNMELNPYQSFSADINVSQGTGAGGGGIAAFGFAGHGDYRLLIGVRVPVERVLGTAQSGFGAKLESEIVVMGRATDTVAYRAGTRVEEALLRQADEQAIGERQVLYALEDGTKVQVAANADGTFTLTYQDGPQGKLGSLKLGSSKDYKTEKGVNKALDSMRIANTYVAPAPEQLALREGESAAGGRAAGDALTARIDRIPADVTSVPDIQDWLQQQIPGLSPDLAGRVDLMNLDAQTARLVANASANLIPDLPLVAQNLYRIQALNAPTDALAFATRDGLSLILNTEQWTDLTDLAARTTGYFAQGWWVSQTPEQLIGHEIGHLVQVNYKITDDTWVAAMDRVAAAGGNPLVSQYAGDEIGESFAETFALLVYGEPTDAQLPIVREMADLLKEGGIDYNNLRAAVGMSPIDLGASA